MLEDDYVLEHEICFNGLLKGGNGSQLLTINPIEMMSAKV